MLNREKRVPCPVGQNRMPMEATTVTIVTSSIISYIIARYRDLISLDEMYMRYFTLYLDTTDVPKVTRTF